MLRPERTALVLLAAGQSRRFGGDKLGAPLLGKPLALHAVAALAAVPFATRIAVVSGTQLDLTGQGYTIVDNPDPAAGQGQSLRLGVTAARHAGIEAILVALADMPCVTAAHVMRLFEAAESPPAVVASSDGTRPMPPALFGAAHFEALLNAAGDAGARDLIRQGRHVLADPAELVDIDTREDLAALAAARLG